MSFFAIQSSFSVCLFIYKTQRCRVAKNNLNTESTRFVADPLTIGKKFENPHLPDSAPEGQ